MRLFLLLLLVMVAICCTSARVPLRPPPIDGSMQRGKSHHHGSDHPHMKDVDDSEETKHPVGNSPPSSSDEDPISGENESSGNDSNESIDDDSSEEKVLHPRLPSRFHHLQFKRPSFYNWFVRVFPFGSIDELALEVLLDITGNLEHLFGDKWVYENVSIEFYMDPYTELSFKLGVPFGPRK